MSEVFDLKENRDTLGEFLLLRSIVQSGKSKEISEQKELNINFTVNGVEVSFKEMATHLDGNSQG